MGYIYIYILTVHYIYLFIYLFIYLSIYFLFISRVSQKKTFSLVNQKNHKKLLSRNYLSLSLSIHLSIHLGVPHCGHLASRHDPSPIEHSKLLKVPISHWTPEEPRLFDAVATLVCLTCFNHFCRFHTLLVKKVSGDATWYDNAKLILSASHEKLSPLDAINSWRHMPQKHTAYLEEQQHHEELAHIVELPLEPTTLWSNCYWTRW